MAIPGMHGCFRCAGLDHWADDCPELIPVETKSQHEERIAKYVRWCFEDDPPRVTPQQKRQLIEHENKMWRDMQPKRERKSA